MGDKTPNRIEIPIVEFNQMRPCAPLSFFILSSADQQGYLFTISVPLPFNS